MFHTKNKNIDIQKLENELVNQIDHGDLSDELENGNNVVEDALTMLQKNIEKKFVYLESVENIENVDQEMERFPSYIQIVAKYAFKIVGYLSRPITHAQTIFNNSVVKLLSDALISLEYAHMDIDGLKRDVTKLRLTIARCENELLNSKANGSSSGEYFDDGKSLDTFYSAFEEQFRGEEALVRERLLEYLPVVKAAKDRVGSEFNVVDLGSGRGEWLKILSENGFTATGVERSREFVEATRRKGFNVEDVDALEYLSSLSDSSVSIVSGFHIIEHFTFSYMVRVFDEALRVLAPGGMIIFETPNPKNLIVGACNFYVDPTHIRQLYPEMIEFLAVNRGFDSAEIKYLHPHPEDQRLTGDEAPVLAAQLNELLSCARDYVVLGYKK
jgi:SAM-dependent methyltransferase